MSITSLLVASGGSITMSVTIRGRIAPSCVDADDNCHSSGMLPRTDQPSGSKSTLAKPRIAFSNNRRTHASSRLGATSGVAPASSVGRAKSKARRARATMNRSAASFLPIWSDASSARDGRVPPTPARLSVADNARHWRIRSMLRTSLAINSNAARTSLLRGVSIVSSWNRQKTSPLERSCRDSVTRTSIRPRTRASAFS